MRYKPPLVRSSALAKLVGEKIYKCVALRCVVTGNTGSLKGEIFVLSAVLVSVIISRRKLTSASPEERPQWSIVNAEFQSHDGPRNTVRGLTARKKKPRLTNRISLGRGLLLISEGRRKTFNQTSTPHPYLVVSL